MNPRFEGTYRFHFQGKKSAEQRNQRGAGLPVED
jgi:hypothetical protein